MGQIESVVVSVFSSVMYSSQKREESDEKSKKHMLFIVGITRMYRH